MVFPAAGCSNKSGGALLSAPVYAGTYFLMTEIIIAMIVLNFTRRIRDMSGIV